MPAYITVVDKDKRVLRMSSRQKRNTHDEMYAELINEYIEEKNEIPRNPELPRAVDKDPTFRPKGYYIMQSSGKTKYALDSDWTKRGQFEDWIKIRGLFRRFKPFKTDVLAFLGMQMRITCQHWALPIRPKLCKTTSSDRICKLPFASNTSLLGTISAFTPDQRPHLRSR